MSDSFLSALSTVADRTIARSGKAPDNRHQQPDAASRRRMDQDTERNSAAGHQMEVDEAPIAQPAAAEPVPQRDIAFLETHVQQYQKRIEDVLAYLQEFRFGRPTPATAHIQQLQKSAQELQADVRSLESEWATWLLLIELRRADETATQAPVEPSTAERFSNQILASRIAGEPAGPLGRILRILNWLEEQHVHLLRIEETGRVSLSSTLRKLQRAEHGDQQRDFLDPDVELRLKANRVLPASGHVLEAQDLTEEQRLLEYVWQLIRAGRLTEAIQLCRTYQQHWRAASLQGGEHIHDGGKIGDDGSVFRVGNPSYLLWRHTCRKLAQAVGVSPVESSIYGLLGGDLAQAVRCAGQYKYEDALYCYLKVLVDEQVDEFIRSEGKADAQLLARIPRPERTQPLDLTLAGVLGSLESPLNTLVTPSVSGQATTSPYLRLQKWLMLDDRERCEEEMVRTIRAHYHGPTAPPPSQQQQEGAVNHTYLLFACHVYLYLHPRCPHAEPLNETGTFLVQSYLAYLEAHPAHHALIASYAQYLSAPARVSFYIRFLRRIDSLEARQQLLAQLGEFNPENVLEVTTGLVQNIIGEEATEKPTGQPMALLMGGGSLSGSLATPASSSLPNLLLQSGGGGVTQSDLEKISSIDCFALQGTDVSLAVVQEALIQATQLYRSFVARGKSAAAKRFAGHLQEKMWEHCIFQTMQRQEQKGEPLPLLWQSLDREYGHWRLYVKCLNWYDAWLTHHSTKPKAPTFHPALYASGAQAQAEYAQFAQRYDRYAHELAAWQASDQSTVGSCVASFMELLEADGGWLSPLEGALRPEELSDLRTTAIPRLVGMIMQVCQESDQAHLCLPLADVIASPTQSLHACFTTDQLRALLNQLREAYIETHLKEQAHEDGNEAEA